MPGRVMLTSLHGYARTFRKFLLEAKLPQIVHRPKTTTDMVVFVHPRIPSYIYLSMSYID